MRFLQLAANLWHWTAHKGLYLQKKNCIYQALSLSSTGRESERRGWGELDPIGSNHPTAIFGQCIPYPASIWIIISSHRMVLVVYMEVPFS